MARIVHREEFLESYNITVFERENKEWIMLCIFNDERIKYKNGEIPYSSHFNKKGESRLGSWSKEKKDVGIDYEEVIRELRRKLSEANTLDHLLDGIDIFPDGWEYWGSFTPEEISDFMDYKYDDFLASYIENEN